MCKVWVGRALRLFTIASVSSFACVPNVLAEAFSLPGIGAHDSAMVMFGMVGLALLLFQMYRFSTIADGSLTAQIEAGGKAATGFGVVGILLSLMAMACLVPVLVALLEQFQVSGLDDIFVYLKKISKPIKEGVSLVSPSIASQTHYSFLAISALLATIGELSLIPAKSLQRRLAASKADARISRMMAAGCSTLSHPYAQKISKSKQK